MQLICLGGFGPSVLTETKYFYLEPLAFANQLLIGNGHFQVSCPSGMNLTACNYASIYGNSYEAYQGFKPVSSNTCECYNFFGMTCAARCVNYTVPEFEIIISYGTGVVQASCPTGKAVLGCHINPIQIVDKFDAWRKWYPSDNGSSCICFDKVQAECYATCASDIKDYEIASAFGAASNSVASCKIAGNVVLGCGHQAEYTSHYVIWTKMLIYNETSCLCISSYKSTCYAICGKFY